MATMVAGLTVQRGSFSEYSRVSPRLYQIANHFRDARTDTATYVFDLDKVAIKAPTQPVSARPALAGPSNARGR